MGMLDERVASRVSFGVSPSANTPMFFAPALTHSPGIFRKAFAHPLALTFPGTSLFIKVVRRLERKINERLRSPMSRQATNR